MRLLSDNGIIFAMSLKYLKKVALLVYILIPASLCAQQHGRAQQSGQSLKFALVIGNSAYSHITRLNNPVNDAADIAGVLEGFGYSVDRVINGSLDQMESAVMRLKSRLSVSQDTYGFVFYAGHGVQSNGENYLLPVDANIPSENLLRQRAVSVQFMLDELNDAGNILNIVVLDACRDNPFSWRRSGSRGLAIVGNQPADSIIVYATSAGSTADDGQGRNGLFTEHFLSNMKIPGLEIHDLFRRTMGDVVRASNNRQRPAVYSQFPGTAYISPPPVQETAMPVLPPEPEVVQTAVVQPAAVQPIPLPLPETKPASPAKPPREPQPPREKAALNPDSRLNTLGVSVGSSFASPIIAGSIRGTIAPSNYTFFEFGMDLGFGSSIENADYFGLYPYIHYNVFVPFTASGSKSKGGWYIGLGAGYMVNWYTFREGSNEYNYLKGDSFSNNTFAGDIVTGFNIADAIDISYTLRTHFQSVSHKVSVGWTKRFR